METDHERAQRICREDLAEATAMHAYWRGASTGMRMTGLENSAARGRVKKYAELIAKCTARVMCDHQLHYQQNLDKIRCNHCGFMMDPYKS